MSRNEWIGPYKLYYKEFNPYKNTWIARQQDLGKCLSVFEAATKAMAFLSKQDEKVEILYLKDGFGNHINP